VERELLSVASAHGLGVVSLSPLGGGREGHQLPEAHAVFSIDIVQLARRRALASRGPGCVSLPGPYAKAALAIRILDCEWRQCGDIAPTAHACHHPRRMSRLTKSLIL